MRAKLVCMCGGGVLVSVCVCVWLCVSVACLLVPSGSDPGVPV